MEPGIHEFISRFKDSGERSQMPFCKRHGISYHKFKYHWKRQQIKKAASERSGFIGLKLDGPVAKIKRMRSPNAYLSTLIVNKTRVFFTLRQICSECVIAYFIV